MQREEREYYCDQVLNQQQTKRECSELPWWPIGSTPQSPRIKCLLDQSQWLVSYGMVFIQWQTEEQNNYFYTYGCESNDLNNLNNLFHLSVHERCFPHFKGKMLMSFTQIKHQCIFVSQQICMSQHRILYAKNVCSLEQEQKHSTRH